MLLKSTIPFAFLLLFCVLSTTDAQQQRQRVRLRQQRPVQQLESAEEETSEEIGRPVIQYYRSQPKQDNAQELVYVSEDEYQNLYAQAQQTTPRPRDYRPAVTSVRPLPRASHVAATTHSPRTKINEEKAPPVQTIRNYNKVNDDGSFTFGYEAADGSFKEETRGTDCVVRGKYGYVDPDGNKREFTYVSGNPCDPNNPDGEEEEEQNRNSSAEDQDENIPANYPQRRPVPVARPRPVQTTARAPTTVFQNRYNAAEEEEEVGIQYAQIPKTTARPQQPGHFIQQTQRPRIQVIQTTPAPQTISYAQSPTPSVNITPKPLYKIQTNNNVLSLQQTQEPATTYRPHTVSIVTPKPAIHTTPAAQFIPSKSVTFGSQAQRGGSIDFDAEFKKFQQETGFQPITPSSPSPQTTRTVKIPSATTSNPIYQTQLVYNPSTGQYDSALYQSIPQTDGDFQLNQRIQPYVQQYQIPQQQQQQQQIYRQQPAAPQPQPQQPQVPQQVYQKQQNEQLFINSQQLFAQQLHMQQSQLQRDRVEAAKKQQGSHRFQLQNAEPSPLLRAQPGQQYYYLQPSAAQNGGGQIEAFLRGHNLEY